MRSRASSGIPAILTSLFLAAHGLVPRWFQYMHFRVNPISYFLTLALVWFVGAVVVFLFASFERADHDMPTQAWKHLAWRNVWIWSTVMTFFHLLFCAWQDVLIRFAEGGPPR